MTPQQYERVSEIFHHALDLPPADREAFIASACAGDAEIRTAVIAMLAQHNSPAMDLDNPALGSNINLSAFITADTQSSAPLPATIGPFKIKSVLGEGGMSIVYRAHQSFPARDVAVKVLRHSIVSPAALRRFHGEVQALARMTHPNIAQIYDAGTFNDGQTDRPYFAMELVDGLPIAEYARQHNLTTAQSLQLIISVCHAVQHAHLRGIIHRDLKSSNILVTADGTPKILDFGIARASDLDVTRATMHTESGQILGTLGYMSPEQLTADPLALDLRTDVYALGAALFETLTGELPHPIDHLPLTHALRRITDTPPRELAALRPDLRGDLDVILATALQSDRDRRYQSAQALAEDLEAFLAFRPIRARPPSRLRLARMWTARHPALATALGLVLITALAFLTFIAVQRHSARLKHERDISAALAQATQLVQSYTDQVSQTRLRQNELADVENWLYRYNAPDRALELERREQQLLRAQSQHEAAFHQALDFLASAERLGVDEPSAKLLYAKLYLARLREAEASGDRFARNLYQNLVHENDPGNLLAGELIDQFPITIHTDPPNTQVHLFRLVEQSELLPDGEPRLIPIPFNDPNPAKTADLTRNFALTILDGKHLVDPNAIVLAVNSFPIRNSLLVTSAPGPIRPLDRLVSIDNQPIRELYDLSHLSSATSQPTTHTYKFAHPGIPDPITLTGPSLESLNITIADPASAIQGLGGVITIYHDGQTSDLVIPPTLRFCITSKPLLLSNASLLGTAPIENHPLDRGTYIALLLADNYEPLRIPIITRESDARSNAAAPPWNLLPLGSTPENFVRLPDSLSMMMRPLWIMRREVTVAEYLEFLNDPETLAAIKNASTPMLVPRTTGIPEFGRNPDGTYNPGEELQPNWPVPCVNWHDAKAYADWMTRRARAAGRDVHFDLPSHQEWLSAWGSSSDNQFPWGDHFRPWWASSNFARATPQIEPVMSFPIDESNLGVFDLAGSLSEWLDAWWMQSRDLREFAGGSWGNGGFNYREMFMLYGQNGITSKATSGTLGFRLVMRLGPPSPPADTN